MVVYSIFDLYGGIQGASFSLVFFEELQIFLAVVCISCVVSFFSTILLYQIKLDEAVIHWRGFMMGVGVALLFDQISILKGLVFPYSLYAVGILGFFGNFFVRMVYQNHTPKGRIVFLSLVFAALVAKLEPSVEPKEYDRDDRPNVILISIDSFNAKILHHEDIQSLKSFSFLSEHGTYFSNMHAACDEPICAYQGLMTADIPLYSVEDALPVSYSIQAQS
jgi:hypothetical protein